MLSRRPNVAADPSRRRTKTSSVWAALLWAAACPLGAGLPATAAEPQETKKEAPRMDVVRDLEFARVGDHGLRLDLYRPAGEGPYPVVLWVHGGAWRNGSKDNPPIQRIVHEGKGFALASVEYRLSPQAAFPAQIHDLKAAVRFLRGEAKKLRLDPDRFAAAGGSAGAHLAVLLGVSGGVAELEGDVGNHLKASSKVQAILDWYGPTNLATILGQSTPHGLSVRKPALQLLLGGQPEEKAELARLASPTVHVAADAPPLWMAHGDQDPQVPVNQSLELQGAYERVGRPVKLEIVHGGAHGGAAFYEPARVQRAAAFLSEAFAAKPDSPKTAAPPAAK